MDHVSHKQPAGFLIFFMTEMWERYGFYIIQTILVFYLLNKLHLDDSKSYVIVGSFTALAYINSFFGGMIADRFVGSVTAIFLGGIFLFLGYIVLGAFPSLIGLSLGLGLVSVGTGLFKPNISSLLSTLYRPNDERKDAGYTLYYVGIYVGALGGSLLGGYIGHYLGWRATFFSSAIGIVLGILVFIFGKIKYKLADKRKMHIPLRDYLYALIAIAVMLLVSCQVLNSEYLSLLYFILIAIFCFGFILYAIIMHRGVERKKLIAFLFLILLAVCYWAIFYQQFFSLSLCTERVCMLPSNVPASSVPSIESLGVILAGPLVNYIWFYCKDRGREISIPTKFSLSFLFNSLCFLLISVGLWYSMSRGVYLSALFIFLAYMIIAIGELCLSPTSLSMVSSLVPARYGSAMMGISLLSIGFGGKLAGFLASSAAINNVKNETIRSMQQIYLQSFFSYFIISMITFVISFILGKYIKRMIYSNRV